MGRLESEQRGDRGQRGPHRLLDLTAPLPPWRGVGRDAASAGINRHPARTGRREIGHRHINPVGSVHHLNGRPNGIDTRVRLPGVQTGRDQMMGPMVIVASKNSDIGP